MQSTLLSHSYPYFCTKLTWFLVDENCLDVLDIQDISDGLEANKVHT